MMPLRSMFAVAVVLGSALALHAQTKGKVDLATPDVRRAVMEKAQQLANPPAPTPLPESLPSPFSPVGFAQMPVSGTGAPVPGGARGADSKAAPVAPPTDRELLASVAAKIPTTGTISLGGKPLLISGKNRLEVGSSFTVVYNGQEYELELVAIERTTFTVRYKGEEFTRPIKLAKSP